MARRNDDPGQFSFYPDMVAHLDLFRMIHRPDMQGNHSWSCGVPGIEAATASQTEVGTDKVTRIRRPFIDDTFTRCQFQSLCRDMQAGKKRTASQLLTISAMAGVGNKRRTIKRVTTGSTTAPSCRGQIKHSSHYGDRLSLSRTNPTLA